MRRLFFLGFILGIVLTLPYEASASPVQRRVHPDFTVPSKIRGRVNFWIDVFTRYSKTQMIVHHREYPQVRFGVIDVTAEAAGLSDEALTRLKKSRAEQETKQLELIFKALAAGEPPQNTFEQSIVDQMAFLPGGKQKYQDVIDNQWIRTQSGIRDKYREAVRRSGRYLPLMEDVFRERNLPVELTHMPFIESSFDYKAYSSVGAAGIWQFMRRTGLQYLRINSLIDERRDPVEATKAAARYLSEAYAKLGSWPLAITSYNHGVYGVARKVREAGTSNLVDLIEDPRKRWFGFASTNFYPEFLAAIEVYDDYTRYFPGLQLEPPLELTEINLSSPTSVSYISKKLGVDVETLRSVNYAVSERVWSGRSSLPPGYALKVPSKYRAAAAALRVPEQKIPSAVKAASAVYGGAAYRVRKGDTLGGIAKRHRVTVASLKELNRLKSDRLVVGQSLIISQRQESGVDEAPAKQPEIRKRRTYKVKRGDNLWSIAKQHGVGVSQLKEANGMKKNDLRAGQVLTIP